MHLTLDCGSTWQLYETPEIFRSIHFLSKTDGFAGSSTGEVYHTTDGGAKWTRQFSPLGSPISELKFIDSQHGWAIGTFGNIIATTNGGSTGVNDGEQVPTVRSNQFTLYQNYPNPFNPTTIISYQIPNDGVVSLKVFNMLGQEVSTLVNQVQPAGSYSVSFDGSQLSSGVYIYTLKAGNLTASKKLLLMK